MNLYQKLRFQNIAHRTACIFQGKNTSKNGYSKIDMQNKIEEQLDRIFSVYIRLKYADHAGFVSCFTCTIRRKWQEMDAGHFISRSNKSTRWDEENVFPQCIEDNRFYGSKHDVFEEVLRDILGEDGFSELLKRSRLPPPSDDQMRKLIIHYTLLVKKMGKVI